MANQTDVKCAHPACRCTVAKDETYCSNYCSDAGKQDVEISCDCGHPGCGLGETPLPGKDPSLVRS